MELFLVCPKCAFFFGSTTARLIEQSGRVECRSCGEAFDGYSHYCFDDSREPIKVTLDEPTREKRLPDQSHRLGLGTPNGAKEVAGDKDTVLQGGAAPELVHSNANLYESVFAPPPVSRSRWWYANIMFCLIFVLILAFSFNRQIYANNPIVAKWAVGLCDSLGCEVGVPRGINALRLIGADLMVRPDLGAFYYQFRATIQNIGERQLKFPAMELKLTDAQGRIVSSKVVYSTDYIGETIQVGIQARSEQQLNLIFRIEGVPPVAFDSYLFYPKKNRR